MRADPHADRGEPRSLVRRWFHVEDIRQGSRTRLRRGVLEVDVSALARSAREPAIVEVRVSLARPGDAVRVANVLDAVVPAVKPGAPDATFPGIVGDEPAGAERTNAASSEPSSTHLLGGVTVLSSLDVSGFLDPADPPPPSFVDMDGPGAALVPWSATQNVVLEFEPAGGAGWDEVARAVRVGTLRAARDLALAATADAAPDREETFSRAHAEASLPGVAAILQLTDEGPGLATYLRGHGIDGRLPAIVDPLDVLDGELTSGAYDSPAARVPTAMLQTSAIVRRLFAEHGGTLRFVGIVLTQGYLDEASEKRRMAEEAARLADEELGAAGAIVNAYSLGNSHTDTMLTVDACERRGVRTVAVVAEEGGLTDHVASADAIVSTGNVLERVHGWRPEVVIGDPGHQPPPFVPVLHYLGASAQTGDTHLHGVSA